MGKINVLSFAVANLIAAGEVVDRPSSVIKELLENAIDSGADRISVEIQNGGVTYMRVSDNGCGISPEDLPVAIRRHATSKIKDAEDLDSIMTLGFRGEALAAIASVSDLRIISKQKEASVGAMLEAHGGNIVGVTERACADGTSVIVENLFSNVPARRKFLKKDITESMAVGAMVEKIALSKPNIAFKLIVDGKVKIDTVGDGSLKSAVYSVFGREFASKLIDADITVDGVRVHGFIGRPDNARANRNYQNFFINGRYVKTKTALAALEQAYTSYMASEKFPCCVLFIDINPATVDVNVHPAKLEVKFSNEKPVFEAIYYCVRNALEKDTQRPSISFTTPKAQRVSDRETPIAETRGESLKQRQITQELYSAQKSGGFQRITAEQYVKTYQKDNDARPKIDDIVKVQVSENKPDLSPTKKSEDISTDKLLDKIAVSVKKSVEAKNEATDNRTVEKKPNVVEIPKTVEQPKSVPVSLSYRIIGEAFNAYVLVEHGDRLLLIDKHAAHERIIFEQLKASMSQRESKASQLLMLPIEVMMTSEEVLLIEEYRKEIEAVGFEFTVGKYTVNVNAVPEGISTDAVTDMLTVIAERIKNNTGSAKLTRDIIFEKALYQASCKAAIKAGREYPREYVKWIVDKLMEIPDITVCPHGRPVAMELTRKNLDYQFERS